MQNRLSRSYYPGNYRKSYPEDNERVPSPILHYLRIGLLILAVLILVFYLVFTRVTGDTLYVDFWVYIAMLGVPPILFLMILGLKLFEVIRKRVVRIIVTWVMVAVVLLGGCLLLSMCSFYNEFGQHPVAYYTNPENGNKLVVMKAADESTVIESEDGSSISYDFTYSLYPMKSSKFYYALRGQEVKSNTGVDYVEWSEDGMIGHVHVIDINGEEQTLDVSFNDADYTEATEEQ